MFNLLEEYWGRNKYLLFAVIGLAIILLIIPLSGNYFLTHIVMLSFLYAFLALAWNLLCGYGGQFSLGHHAFFGIGAYVTAILMISYNVSPWIGMLIGGLAGALLAVAVSPPLFRLKSHWFTLATLALGEILKLIFINWKFVGGAKGLLLPVKPASIYWLTFASPFAYYYIMLGLLAVEMMILYKVINSKIGYSLQIIREDEYVAMAVGINPLKYKAIALIIGGFFVGVGGGFYITKYRFIDPFSGMDLFISVDIALAGIIGGLYTFIGPVIGSMIVIPVSYYARAVFGTLLGGEFFGIHRLVYGIVLLAVALFMPRGIMGWLKVKIPLLKGKRS